MSGTTVGARTQAEKARLSASIADARAELASTLGELRAVVRDQVDWRGFVRRSPLVAVGLAALLGWRLGRGRWL